MECPRVAGARERDRLVHEQALPCAALDQGDLGTGERKRERDSRKTCAGTEIRDRRGRLRLGELKRDERIGEVIVKHLRGVTDRGGGPWVRRDEFNQRQELLADARGQPISIKQHADPSLKRTLPGITRHAASIPIASALAIDVAGITLEHQVQAIGGVTVE